MTKPRYELELSVLQQKLQPNLYRFMDTDTRKPYLIIAAKTNRGNIYTLKVDLEEFPNSIPAVTVLNDIRDKKGNKLTSVSGAMHVLGLHNGHTKICHYGYSSWTPNVSLYKIYVKCRLWLEMYEMHLKTGRDIDHYLKHQS